MSVKKDKEEVDYSEGRMKEHCGNCSHFLVDKQACTKVKGHIMARMWCRLFEKKHAAART